MLLIIKQLIGTEQTKLKREFHHLIPVNITFTSLHWDCIIAHEMRALGSMSPVAACIITPEVVLYSSTIQLNQVRVSESRSSMASSRGLDVHYLVPAQIGPSFLYSIFLSLFICPLNLPLERFSILYSTVAYVVQMEWMNNTEERRPTSSEFLKYTGADPLAVRLSPCHPRHFP